jgi:putative hydrolase of the HAD superfamily
LIVESVILDFGGTLVEGGIEWGQYHKTVKSLLERFREDVSMEEIREKLGLSLDKLHEVRATGKELTFEEIYEDFLDRLGIAAEEELLVLLHDNFKEQYKSKFFECSGKVLEKLSKKYKVALLSNTISDQPHLLLNESGFDKYFDVIVCSRDIGVRKPNPEAFKIILEKLDTTPGITVHVGDSVEADMYGARESGITGIWVRTPDQPYWDGFSIVSICELPDFLKRLENSKQS